MSFWSGFATGTIVTIAVVAAGVAGAKIPAGRIDEEEARWFEQEAKGKRYVLFNWHTSSGQLKQVLETSNDLRVLRDETWRLPEGVYVGIWDTLDRTVVYNRHR